VHEALKSGKLKGKKSINGRVTPTPSTASALNMRLLMTSRSNDTSIGTQRRGRRDHRKGEPERTLPTWSSARSPATVASHCHAEHCRRFNQRSRGGQHPRIGSPRPCGQSGPRHLVDTRPAQRSARIRSIEFASDEPSVPPQEASGRAAAAISMNTLRPNRRPISPRVARVLSASFKRASTDPLGSDLR